MSAPATQAKSKITLAYKQILKVTEDIEMKMRLHMIDVKLSEVLSSKAVAKMLGGLALGAVLMTAVALPFGTTYADEPSRPLVSEESLINLGAGNLPGDAWIFDSPFYETIPGSSNLKGSSVEVQRIPDDAWIFDSPFYETVPGSSDLKASNIDVQRTSDDAWIFDAPFYEALPEVGNVKVSGVEAQRTPADAWVFNAPFYQTLSEIGSVKVSSIEVQRIPDDAWIFNAPFYEALPGPSNVEVQRTPGDSLIFKAPFNDEFLAE